MYLVLLKIKKKQHTDWVTNWFLQKNVDKAVSNKANATIVGEIKINSIEWYVPHYTPSIPQQGILSKQILNETPT